MFFTQCGFWHDSSSAGVSGGERAVLRLGSSAVTLLTSPHSQTPHIVTQRSGWIGIMWHYRGRVLPFRRVLSSVCSGLNCDVEDNSLHAVYFSGVGSYERKLGQLRSVPATQMTSCVQRILQWSISCPGCRAVLTARIKCSAVNTVKRSVFSSLSISSGIRWLRQAWWCLQRATSGFACHQWSPVPPRVVNLLFKSLLQSLFLKV